MRPFLLKKMHKQRLINPHSGLSVIYKFLILAR